MSTAEKEDCFCLTWEIENYKLLLDKDKGILTSPIWKIESSEGSTWLYLSVDNFREDVNFKLIPLSDACWSPDKCKIFLISSFGKVLMVASSTVYFSIKKNAVFGNKTKSILPKDTLTVCCRMWKETLKPGVVRISSVLQNVNYLWKVEGFKVFHSISHSFVNKESQIFYITLERDSDNKDQCTVTVRGETTREGIISIVKCKITANVGLERVKPNRNYIPNPTTWKCDVEINAAPGTSLQLQLELVYTIGTISASSSSLSSDLQHLYKDGLYSDVKIHAEGKSFPAHRNILAARSPVFRAMFEKDEMSEARSGVVDIDDVDSETMDRMLVFLYGDSLEGVQWEEASALYYAADKYDVLSLKQKCSDILKGGLSVDNACDVLFLADTHSDEELMRCVVDFIRDNREVVSSRGWEELEDSNPRLTSKVVRKLFLRLISKK